MHILAFFAHPDDETMLAGGTLALLARLGAAVHYLCATRGEGGELGDPPLCTRAGLAAVRSDELTCAIHALGGASLEFLGYVDPPVGPGDSLHPYAVDTAGVAQRLEQVIRRWNIQTLITHGSNGEYGHPAHLQTHAAARLAVEHMGDAAPLLYSVQAAFPEHPKPRLVNPRDVAHLILDVSPVLEEKTLAALCHRTQHALFVRRASQAAGRQLTVPEVIISLESLHRTLPVAPAPPRDALALMLLSSGAATLFQPS